MKILSQDRTKIVYVGGVIDIEKMYNTDTKKVAGYEIETDFKITGYKIMADEECVGTYKTEERAKQVISSIYQSISDTYIMEED